MITYRSGGSLRRKSQIRASMRRWEREKLLVAIREAIKKDFAALPHHKYRYHVCIESFVNSMRAKQALVAWVFSRLKTAGLIGAPENSIPHDCYRVACHTPPRCGKQPVSPFSWKHDYRRRQSTPWGLTQLRCPQGRFCFLPSGRSQHWAHNGYMGQSPSLGYGTRRRRTLGPLWPFPASSSCSRRIWYRPCRILLVKHDPLPHRQCRPTPRHGDAIHRPHLQRRRGMGRWIRPRDLGALV